MPEYAPELYIIDKQGDRRYAGESYREWYKFRDALIGSPILFIAVNLFYQNLYLNIVLGLIIAWAAFNVWAWWDIVYMLDRERVNRKRDLEEREKIEASRPPIPRQEPHGRTPTKGII